MREQHRLRALQMRVGGHDGVACGFGPLYQGQGPVAQQFLSLRCMLAHVKAQVGRDLLIAAAAGVELQGQLANARRSIRARRNDVRLRHANRMPARRAERRPSSP